MDFSFMHEFMKTCFALGVEHLGICVIHEFLDNVCIHSALAWDSRQKQFPIYQKPYMFCEEQFLGEPSAIKSYPWL